MNSGREFHEPSPEECSGEGLPSREAEAWVIRLDRGLTLAERAAFEDWRRASPLNEAALEEVAGDWMLLNRFPEAAAAPVGAEAKRVKPRLWSRSLPWRSVLGWLSAVGAAAAVAFSLLMPASSSDAGAAILAFHSEDTVKEAMLPDGSQLMLNAGSVALVRLGPGERTVRLLRGEAHFIVAKDAGRPFVVLAGSARLRAVGTAFNVQLQPHAVDVVVTEGRVLFGGAGMRGATAASSEAAPSPSGVDAGTVLDAGQRGLLQQTEVAADAVAVPPPLVVTHLDNEQLSEALSWQGSLLRLGGFTLGEVVRELSRRNGCTIVLEDEGLERLRVGGFFRQDDPEGFLHLLDRCFGIHVERRPEGTVILRKKE